MRHSFAVVAVSLAVLSCNSTPDLASPDSGPDVRFVDEVPPPCNDCILSPIVLGTENAGKIPYSTEFKAIPGDYLILLSTNDQYGGVLELELNGALLPSVKSQKIPTSGSLTISVRLDVINRLKARVLGRPDLRFILEIPRPLPPGPCSASPLFTAPTTPIDQLRAIVPLGNLNTPEHVIPAPHIYMWPVDAGVAGRVPIHAPAFSRVIAIGVDEEFGDYYAYLSPCAEARVYFIHIKEFAPRLAGLAAAPFGGYRLGPGFFKLVVVDLSAGELIGYADRERGPYDVGFIDSRRTPLAFANPDRYSVPASSIPPGTPPELVEALTGGRLNQYCILNEFTGTLKTQLEALLGRYDASVRRTAAPVCGTQMQDVPGTAQGNWFTETGGGIPERGRIALVHDNVDPTIPIFSIGDDFLAWGVGAWRFTPSAGGMVNRDFDDVAPDAVYCYDGVTSGPTDLGRGLVEVFSEGGGTANRLRIERQPGMTCGAGPWSFGAGAAVFQR